METLERLQHDDPSLTQIAFRSDATNRPRREMDSPRHSWDIASAASIVVPSTNERQLSRLSRQLDYAVRANAHLETVFVLVGQEAIVESTDEYGMAERMWGLMQQLGSFSKLKTLVIKADIHLEMLTELLKTAQNLVTFELIDYCDIQGEDGLSRFALINFCHSLKGHCSLRRIKFEPVVRVEDQYEYYSTIQLRIEPIIRAFSKLPELEVLHIRPKFDDYFFSLDDAAFRFVSDSALAELCTAPKLRDLEIDFRPSPDPDMEFNPNYRFSLRGGGLLLTEAIMNSSSLRKVSFRAEGDGVASNLAKALCENTSLESVQVMQNRIETDTMRTLAHSLTLNSTLVELDLSDCLLGSSDVSVLTTALEINSTLKILKLARNQLKDEAFESFAKALEKNETLETLDLMGSDGSRAIFGDALQHNTTLVHLETEWQDLDDPSFSDDDSRALERFIPDLDIVVDFYLFLNRAGRKLFNELLKSPSASLVDFVQCLVKVEEVHEEICQTRSAWEYFYDHHEDVLEGFEDEEEFEDAELLSGIYYFLRKEPTKFFSNLENGLRDEQEGAVTGPPAKKLKRS